MLRIGINEFYKKISKYNLAITADHNSEKYEHYLNNISNKFNEVFSFNLTDKPDLIIYKSYKTDGGIFESSRLFNYGIMFYVEYVLIFRIVETSGWNKEFDFLLKIGINDFLNASSLKDKGCFLIQLNLKKKYIQELKSSKSEVFENLNKEIYENSISFKYIDQTSFQLFHFIDKENNNAIPIIIDFINKWKDNYELMVDEATNIFSALDESNDLSETEISTYPFKNDASFLYLESKCERGRKSFDLLNNALDKVINHGSIVNNLDEIIAHRLMSIDMSFCSPEQQLDLLNKINIILNEDNKEVVNQIYSLEKSIVTESLNELSNSISNKLLVINQEGKFLKSTNFVTIPQFDIPDQIQFPPGHPIGKQTYVQHPILLNQYIPLDDYEVTILKDKIDEFKFLVQALGAISVEYLDVENHVNSNRTQEKKSISVDGNVKMVGASVEHNGDSMNSSSIKNSSIRKEKQLFDPMGMPYIPNNLIWFHHEMSWQRLAKQRLEGNVLSHSETINISKSDSFNSLDLDEIKAEIKTVVKGVSFNKKKNEMKDSTSELFKEIFIDVKFANILDLKKLHNVSSNEISINSSNVFEFFTEFTSNYGKLGQEGIDIFTSILNYLQINISDHSNFLEKINKSQLSDKDKEYIDMVKIISADGIITEKERNILNTFAGKLDLSHKQQEYLESLILIK